MPDDRLDILIRVDSDVKGAEAAKAALNDFGNVVKVSNKDVAAATQETDKLNFSHRGLHRAAGELSRTFPELGNAMHAALFGGAGAIFLIIEAFSKLKDELKEQKQMWADWETLSMEQATAQTRRLAEANEELKKNREETERWMAEMKINLNARVQDLTAFVAQLHSVNEAQNKTLTTEQELGAAVRERMKNLGLLSDIGQISQNFDATTKAEDATMLRKQNAAQGERYTKYATQTQEERDEDAAQKRLTGLQNQPGQAERSDKMGAFDKEIERNEDNLAKIRKAIAKVNQGLDPDNADLPTGVHQRPAFQGRDSYLGELKGSEKSYSDSIASARGERSKLQSEKDALDAAIAQAKKEMDAHHKNVDALKQEIKALDGQIVALDVEAAGLKTKHHLDAVKTLGEIGKTAAGGLLERGATEEMFALHQRDRQRHGKPGEVFDATTGTWRAARPGEAPTGLTPAQQGDLSGSVGLLNNQGSAKDQQEILKGLGLKPQTGKSFGDQVMEALALTMGNDEKHTQLLIQIIQKLQQHGYKLDGLTVQ